MKHIIQNWSKEPFIKGSYSIKFDNAESKTISAPVEKKIYFAGEALSKENHATVHGACETVYSAVEKMLKN